MITGILSILRRPCGEAEAMYKGRRGRRGGEKKEKHNMSKMPL